MVSVSDAITKRSGSQGNVRLDSKCDENAGKVTRTVASATSKAGLAASQTLLFTFLGGWITL